MAAFSLGFGGHFLFEVMRFFGIWFLVICGASTRFFCCGSAALCSLWNSFLFLGGQAFLFNSVVLARSFEMGWH